MMVQFAKRSLLFTVLSGCMAMAQNTPTPRASAAAYPAHQAKPIYSIGAKQLSKTEVQNSFATPMAGKYVVVEIGFFPAGSETVALKQSDFVLKSSDGKDVMSPASPQTVAAVTQKRPPDGTDVAVSPSASIGYVSYPDPYTGRRVSGPVVGAGVGVGVDKTPSGATTDTDRQTMETELMDKELKDADVSKPVAGYLYFPIPSKQKGDYQLEYSGTTGPTTLQLKTH
jgi:hypothetical protein